MKTESGIRGRLFGLFRVQDPVKWIFYSIAVGVISGLFCCAFFYLLEYTQHLLFADLAGLPQPSPAGEALFSPPPDVHPRPHVFFLLPLLGGLISGLLVYLFAPEAEGHGTDALIDAFHNKMGIIRTRIPFIKAAASLATLATGGSAGREGPVAQIGGGLGSWMARRLGFSARNRRILMLAGTAGGLGSIFRSPLGGAITAIEVLYRRDFETEALIPAIISSVTAYTVFSTVFGHQSIFLVPEYNWSNPVELLFYAVLALVCVPMGILFIKLFYAMRDRVFSPLPLPRFLKPMLGGLGVACLGLLLPQVYGSGWGQIQLSLSGELGIGLMFAIAIGKMLATSFTIGSGGSGGVFGPSLFIGAMLGGAFGGACHHFFPDIVTAPETFVLVGMCAFFAGVAHAPIGALLMISEMSGSYGLIAPLMLVSVITLVFNRRWSIYEKQVRDKFDSPAHIGDLTINVLEQMTVKDVYRQRTDVVSLQSGTTFPALRRLIAETEVDYFPVYDGERLSGILPLEAIRPVLFEEAADRILIVKDVAMPLVVATPEESLYEALIKFLQCGYACVPVVREEDPNEILGFLRQEDVMNAYGSEITLRTSEVEAAVQGKKVYYKGASTAGSGTREHFHLRGGVTLARIVPPPFLVGRSLRQADLRAAFHLTVVAVRCKGQRDEELPDPEAPLAVGDVLVVVGSPQDISRFQTARDDRDATARSDDVS